MGVVVAEFFNAIGVGVTLPTNMIELIPYLLTVFFGVLAVALTFALLIALVKLIADHRRF